MPDEAEVHLAAETQDGPGRARHKTAGTAAKKPAT
jgi:hypothetical protein